MITEKFKERINYLKNNHLIVEALYEILDELKLKHNAFTGFTFREEIDPKSFLLTAEGEEKTGITIRVPRNILDFDLKQQLILNLRSYKYPHLFHFLQNQHVEVKCKVASQFLSMVKGVFELDEKIVTPFKFNVTPDVDIRRDFSAVFERV